MPTYPVYSGQKFSNQGELCRYQKNSYGPFACQTCKTPFSSHEALLEHAAVHSVRCGACRRRFKSERGLQRHFYDSPKHPKCRACAIGFEVPADVHAHRAQVHESKKSKNWIRRAVSSVASGHTSHTSPTLRSQSPFSSIASMASNEIDARRLPTPSHSTEEVNRDTTSMTIADGLPTIVDSPHPNFLLDEDCCENEQECDVGVCAQKNSLESRDASSPSKGLVQRLVPSVISLLELSVKAHEGDQSPQSIQYERSAFVDMTNGLSSPLLGVDVPLPSTSGSPSSDDFASLHDVNDVAHCNVPSLEDDNAAGDWIHQSSDESTKTLGSASMTPTNYGLADTSRDSLNGCCSPVMRVASPTRLGSPSNLSKWFQLSKLPTISDESELDLEQELVWDTSPSLIPDVPTEASELMQPSKRRKRRLSLSPTLPSIPETTLVHEADVRSPIDQDDSDSVSSQGIHEYRAGEFLFDDQSDNERTQTPMSYLTADELGVESGTEKYNDDHPAPIFLVEDLTRLIEELTPPSTANSEFFDPFELHPSANNSPMSATFPKRPRAWSLSAPNSDGNFLSPGVSRSVSRETAVGKLEERPEGHPAENPGVGEEGPDEAAVAADEPLPVVLEEDLFSETDEVLEVSQGMLRRYPIDTVDGAQFSEGGHALRSITSFDVLPFIGTTSSDAGRAGQEVQVQSQEGNSSEAAEQKQKRPLNPEPLLRCRLCQVDPCREVTATFCGHVFCNDCITREIMEKSKCPVCSTPTLLYCLFKLDLSC